MPSLPKAQAVQEGQMSNERNNERVTPEAIQALQPGQVFVFGSNEAGRHGRGAARQAMMFFGASYGMGHGLWGQSYAIPTKDSRMQTLPFDGIRFYVDRFVKWAARTPDKTYLVTEIGCGLAGYYPREIAPLFKGCVELPNVHLPARFWKELT